MRATPCVHNCDDAGGALVKLRVSLARLAQKAGIGNEIPGFPKHTHDHDNNLISISGQDAAFEMLNESANYERGGWNRLVNLLMDEVGGD
jgi:hypothetical protein